VVNRIGTATDDAVHLLVMASCKACRAYRLYGPIPFAR